MNVLSGFIWRLVRTASGLGLASLVALATSDPRWIWLAPVITAVAKVLREKFSLLNIPL